MKSMWPASAAIFFMTYFLRAGGGDHGPLGPPDPLLLDPFTEKPGGGGQIHLC